MSEPQVEPKGTAVVTDPNPEPKGTAVVTEPNQEPKPDPKGGNDKVEPKSYSREDIAKIVAGQLKQERDKWEQEEADKLAKAKAEGAEEAKMTAEQLAQKQSEEREAKLKEREERLAQTESELTTKTLMSNKQLPQPVADIMLKPLTKVEPDKREKAIDGINKAIAEAVQTAVLEKTKGKATPEAGSGAIKKVPDKKWNDMTYTEQLAIYRENPDLAKQLEQQN